MLGKIFNATGLGVQKDKLKRSRETDLAKRQWLKRFSIPAFAAAGIGWTNSSYAAAGAKIKEGQHKGIGVYNISDFGAKGDNKTLNTTAIQSAVDTCTRDAGGTVIIPAGIFLTGTIELKSNVRLYLSAQAVLLGTDDGRQYYPAPAIPLSGDSTLDDGNVGLFFAVKADNITIEGPGMIDGQGARFRSPSKGLPSPAGISGPQRPYHLLFYQCNKLIVRDIFLHNSAFHSVRVIQCEYARFDGLHIRGKVINNNDGFHFVSCKYLHVTNCDVQSQDDACALFGSCKFVTISNCSFSTRWSVFRFGGGEAEDITISNCLIYEVYGCPIKLHCGPGSRFENISFSNIIMRDVTGPISIGLASHSSKPSGSATPGIVRNIAFNGIRATVVKPVLLRDSEVVSKYNPGEEFSCVTLNAMDDVFLENITFNDVHIKYPGGGSAEHAALRDVPKVAGEYYQMGIPPSFGIYARNVRELILNNISLTTDSPDLRPALILDHVQGAGINFLNVQGNDQAASVCRIINSKDILITAARLTTPTRRFLQLEGIENSGIKIDGGDLSKAGTLIAFNEGAKADMVKIRE